MEQRVLIASSENAIRGILMYLCDIPEDKIAQLSIPNGVPIIYDVASRTVKLIQEEAGMDPLEKYDFGDAAEYLFQDSESRENGDSIDDEQCDVDNLSEETMAELNKLYAAETAEKEEVLAAP
jgi:2,3-bisphosphoglycerate-dependent phosphoglycerate mutase